MAKDERFVKGSNLTLSGCPVKWAYLINPDTAFNDRKWSIDAYLNDEDAKELKSLGFNIKDSEDGPFIKLKRKCTTAAGKDLTPPQVVGKDPSIPFTEEVGNGSICNILVYAVFRSIKGRDVLCAYLEKVQVVDHVAREAREDTGFEDLS